MGIPDTFSDNKLEEKVVEPFQQIDGNINTDGIEDSDQQGKSNKNQIVHFANRQKCKAILKKSLRQTRNWKMSS